jgi:hypothetical protein
MSKKTPRSLDDVIAGIVRQEFADAVIDHVIVREDVDNEGEDVLLITVVFASAKLDASKALGLARHLRPAFEERSELRFPIISYRSAADHKRLSEAA